MKGIREEAVASVVEQNLQRLQFSAEEKEYLAAAIQRLKANWFQEKEQRLVVLNVKLQQVSERQKRLTDAYLDQAVERDLYEARKTALFFEKRAIEDQLKDFTNNKRSVPDELHRFIELAGDSYSLYQTAIPDKKRRMLKIITSNLTVDRKKLHFTFSIPFHEIANREHDVDGRPSKVVRRTLDSLISSLLAKVETCAALNADFETDPFS